MIDVDIRVCGYKMNTSDFYFYFGSAKETFYKLERGTSRGTLQRLSDQENTSDIYHKNTELSNFISKINHL